MLFARKVFRNIISRIKNKSPRIKWVVFEVTDACNSRCVHCNIWRKKKTQNLLTPQEIETLFKDNFFNDLKKVVLTGGEPILRHDIKEVITAIHKARPRVKMTLSTNGLLPERVLDVLKYAINNNIHLSIGISLDAIGEKHDLIRGVPGNFEKVEYLIKGVIELKNRHKDKIKNITLGHTLSSLTQETVEEVRKYANNLGVGFLTQLYEEFPYYNIKNRGKEKPNNKKTHLYQLIKVIKKLPPSLHHEVLLEAIRGKLKYKCASLQTFFLLRCDGNIVPCLQFSDIKVGNIREMSIEKIWNSESYRKTRKLVSKCRGCSNAWAYAWSLDYWPLPFWKLLIRVKIKKYLKYFKHA